MWARGRRVWASGGEAPASPGLLHTVRRTAPGPQDASTSSPLGAAMVVAVVSPPLQTKKELARAGRQTPPGHGRLQLRYKTGLTGEEYVGTEAWRDATSRALPEHPPRGMFVRTPWHPCQRSYSCRPVRRARRRRRSATVRCSRRCGPSLRRLGSARRLSSRRWSQRRALRLPGAKMLEPELLARAPRALNMRIG